MILQKEGYSLCFHKSPQHFTFGKSAKISSGAGTPNLVSSHFSLTLSVMAFFRWKCLPRCCCLFENCFELVFRMILHLICHVHPPFWPWSMGQVRVQGTLGKFSDDQLTSLFSSTCFSSLLAFITSDNKFFSWLWEKRGTVKTRFHVLFKATEVSSVYSLSNLWTGPLIPPTVLKLMKQRFPVASK